MARRSPARAPVPSPLPPAALPARRPARSAGPGSELPGRGGARGAGARCLPAGGRDAAAPRWAARPASAPLGSARSLGSARLGSARRCPGRSLAAHAARGGRGAGWRAGTGGGRGSGPPRGRLEAPYLGSDVRGSRRARTTHFFPFTPQSFLSPSPGDPARPRRAPLRPARPRRARPRGQPLGVPARPPPAPAPAPGPGPGPGGRRGGGRGASGESQAPGGRGRVCAAASTVTGRVTLGTAPPSAPAPAPALSFPPGPSGKGRQGSPARRRRRRGPRLGRTRPGGRPSSSPKGALPAVLSGASPAPLREARASPGGNISAFSRSGRGGPGRAPGAAAWGLGWGHPGASQWPDFTRSHQIPGRGP